MNWETVEENWEQYKGSTQTKWGKLTDRDLKESAGKQHKLSLLLQEKYGYSQQKADMETEKWLSSL